MKKKSEGFEDVPAYEDIPGTWVFDAQRGRKGYHLNAFFYSLPIGVAGVLALRLRRRSGRKVPPA